MHIISFNQNVWAGTTEKPNCSCGERRGKGRLFSPNIPYLASAISVNDFTDTLFIEVVTRSGTTTYKIDNMSKCVEKLGYLGMVLA